MSANNQQFDAVEEAIEAIANGEFVVVVDDTDRENEGDLIIAAEKITPEKMAFLVRYSSGVVCVALSGERIDQLKLPQMVQKNNESFTTAFTVSVDYLHGTTTGISASDRALTLNALADEMTTGDDFAKPGHIFPLRARDGGVLERPGHTEAALDLAKLAGLKSAGVLCEIVNEDGSMARRPDLFSFAKQHQLKIITIADLISHRVRTENHFQRIASAKLPTKHGLFQSSVFRSAQSQEEHIVLHVGELENAKNVLLRIHSECLTGDAFGSLKCDCGEQLEASLQQIASAGTGVLVYLRGQEGRGIGLANKIRAYQLQDRGLDTVEANQALGLPVDSRHYHAVSKILALMHIQSVRLMTNNPEKEASLRLSGVNISERVSLEVKANPFNLSYLQTKRNKLNHHLLLTNQDKERHQTQAAKTPVVS